MNVCKFTESRVRTIRLSFVGHFVWQTASPSLVIWNSRRTFHCNTCSELSWFDMWFNVVKPRFLFKTVDPWSYINAQLQLLAYALNQIESAFFSQNLPKNPEKQTKFKGFPLIYVGPQVHCSLEQKIKVFAGHFELLNNLSK